MRTSSIVLALTCASCAAAGTRAPSADERAAEGDRVLALARSPQATGMKSAWSPGGPPFQPVPAEWMRGTPEAAARFAFELGAAGRDDAADLIEANLRADTHPDVVAAAATGLGYCKSDATERVGALALAMRPSQPPEAVEALFSYYRFRGADKPPPTKLPDDRLLAYAKHATGRGRAALGHLGRVVKDPALVDVLGDLLATDADFEVRRAAVLGLAEGPTKKERPAELRATCLDFLQYALGDADAHVVASACRVVASYDDPRSAELLMTKLEHADFNVRVAALEGLGKRKAKAAVGAMEQLAENDPSNSVRYTAARQLAEIDIAVALRVAGDRLGKENPLMMTGAGYLRFMDASEYVRCGAVEVLGKSADADASRRLDDKLRSEDHVRVRGAIIDAFKGKKDDVAKEAVRRALADADAGVAGTACGVVAKNEWKDMTELVAGVPARFPGCLGADAREAALSALSEIDGKAHAALFASHVRDDNPAVRAAADKALAVLDGRKDAPPPPPSRGADLTGDLLPGGAPIFERDAFLVVQTDQGTMKIRLFPDQAPVHCAHVAALARQGFYDGLSWHRVVPDFVIQGGCPRGDGSGNAGVTLPLEPTRIPFERGTLGMPRSDHPDTGGCQLFICHSRAPHLDVRYVAFGKVVEGLDVIDKIDVDGILRVHVEGVR